MIVPQTVSLARWEPSWGGLLVTVWFSGLPERAPLPPGYSPVWKAWDRAGIVCAPVPLNFLLWQLPWRYSRAMDWLVWNGALVPPYEGCFFRECRVEWRFWHWRVW